MATSLPVTYPLSGPQVSGNEITADLMLNEPTRITSYLNDLTLRNYFMPLVYGTAPGINGGALLYNQITYNDLFPTRDVQDVAPGSEFPNVTADRPDPKVARVGKFGGKFEITDEARDRNDIMAVQQEATKLGNAMVRRMNAKGIAVLDEAVTAVGAPGTFVGTNWGNVTTAGTSATSNQGYPAADFAKAQLKADQTELGVDFNLWIVNPQEKANLSITYGSQLDNVLSSFGITMYPTNRVAAGTAYVLAQGQVGVMGVEKGLSTETWRDADRQVTVSQTDVRMLWAVTNPYSVIKVTGLAG